MKTGELLSSLDTAAKNDKAIPMRQTASIADSVSSPYLALYLKRDIWDIKSFKLVGSKNTENVKEYHS